MPATPNRPPRSTNGTEDFEPAVSAMDDSAEDEVSLADYDDFGLGDRIREQPIKSVLIAMGVAIVLGRFFL